MIQITFTVTECNGIASAKATINDTSATPLEKIYFQSTAEIFGLPNNLIHILSKATAEQYVESKESLGRRNND